MLYEHRNEFLVANDEVTPDCSEEWHPLSAGQRSFWFMYKLHPELRGTYDEGFCIRIMSELDTARLRRALNVLAQRHPMLRVRFREVDGQPEQCADPEVVVPVEVFNAEDLDDATLRRRVAQDYARSFDLAITPRMRASVYRLRDKQSVLLVVLDHIACDGWSYWRLIGELGEILAAGDATTAPSNALSDEQSYFAYVRHQREWLSSKRGEKQLTYWRQALGEVYPALELPKDTVHVGPGHTQPACVRCVLPPELTG